MTGLENLEAGGGEYYVNADGELFAADPVTNGLTPVSELPAPTPSDGWETAHETAPKILAAAITIVSSILGSAGSDPGWQGPAAQSYDDRNSEQQDRITQMVELDTELAGLLQTQAAEVEELRANMYGVGGTLSAGTTDDQCSDVMKKAGSSLTIKYGSHNPVRTTQVRTT
jgi:hypothetical protein